MLGLFCDKTYGRITYYYNGNGNRDNYEKNIETKTRMLLLDQESINEFFIDTFSTAAKNLRYLTSSNAFPGGNGNTNNHCLKMRCNQKRLLFTGLIL